MADRKIKDSVVTITGGTGSFGSTMIPHILAGGASEIRIFSRDESKQDALRNQFSDPRLRFYIGDVRDESAVGRVIKGSNLVFHAAALKQVPSCEFFPMEATKTNVLGSNNVLSASVQHAVQAVICLSTDKAVYPINAMGMTKGLMEKTAQSVARETKSSETVVAITRYGNVMNSRGSVIPLFLNQIRSGTPITVTNPQMTRFLMTLQESVDLVLHALQFASTGDILVRKAPASSIAVLAEALTQLFGTGSDPIKEIGPRHGEKLFESLLSAEEKAVAEDAGSYFRVPMDLRDLNYDSFYNNGQDLPEDVQAYTSHNTEQLDVEAVKAKVLEIPELRLGLK